MLATILKEMKIVIDTVERTLTRQSGGLETKVDLFTKEAFQALSLEWVRVGPAAAEAHDSLLARFRRCRMKRPPPSPRRTDGTSRR